MTTAPSEMRTATGMLPWAGGFRSLVIVGECFGFSPGVGSLAFAERGNVAKIPKAADFWRSSLLFMAVLLFENMRFKLLTPKTIRVENSVPWAHVLLACGKASGLRGGPELRVRPIVRATVRHHAGCVFFSRRRVRANATTFSRRSASAAATSRPFGVNR